MNFNAIALRNPRYQSRIIISLFLNSTFPPPPQKVAIKVAFLSLKQAMMS